LLHHGQAKSRGEKVNEGKYILIVEDDDDARLVFSIVLGRHYPVLTAESAAEARKLLAEHRRHVRAIILDILLPGGEDGLSLARWLRTQADWKDVPIIAVTAVLFADQRNVFEAGCNAHIAKPVRPSDLVDIVSLYSGDRSAPIQ
jgi:CheY-like chemotaxis protein